MLYDEPDLPDGSKLGARLLAAGALIDSKFHRHTLRLPVVYVETP